MKVKGLRWVVIGLIMLITIINYLDRGTLNYMWVANIDYRLLPEAEALSDKGRISSAQSSPRHGIPDPASAGCPAALYLWSSWKKTAFGSIFILCHLRIRGRIPPVLYSRQVSPDYRCICRQHRNPDRMRHHIPCIT